jgi:hypothetical protein
VLGAVIPVPADVVLNLAMKVKAPSFHYERFIAQLAIYYIVFIACAS